MAEAARPNQGMSMGDYPFHYVWRWALRSDAASLWPLISDTDRFNEVTGFPAPVYSEVPLPEGGSRRMARIRQYGAVLQWYDAPFEWVQGREYVQVRHCTRGPLGETKTVVRLEPQSDGGTTLTYEIFARPGNLLGWPGIPVQLGVLTRLQFARAFRRVDDYVQQRAPTPFAAPRTPLRQAGMARLRDFGGQLVALGQDAALVTRLLDHLRHAPDNRLTRMRPYALADEWNADRRTVLELFLRASRLGLLDISWDMLCPECRGAKQHAGHLHEVSAHGHCPSCNVDYEVDFARSVEATFSVNAAIKAVMRKEFCVGGPQNTPHILAQQVLAPGETRLLQLPLEARLYRWRAPRMAGANPEERTITPVDDAASGRVLLDVDPSTAATSATVILDDRGLTVTADSLHDGPATFTLHNNTAREQILLLEETAWAEYACSAATITSLQAFRDLYSDEALRPGEAISVESMAILFTDLKGSTALYRAIGDAPAFGRVMSHFDLLRGGVAAHGGGLVKTIGDSIMAVFPDPADGLAAALKILEEFRQYNAAHPDGPLVLKMGLHCGPCIAVTLNERLDYFGSVVNLAARLEGQSEGNDVVLSAAMASDPAVAERLADSSVMVAPFTAQLKGFAEPISLRRVRLAPSPPPVAALVPIPAPLLARV